MNETLKYKILTTIRYLGDAFFYPFLSLFLVSTGLAEAKIGFILSITPIIGILVNPIYANICKDIKVTKNVLKYITIIEAVIIVIISFSSNFYLISFLVVLLAISGTSHYGLMDSLLVVYSNENRINYSTIRVFGSIAYIIGTTLGGFAIEYFDYQITFIIASSLFILSGGLYQLLKPVEINDIELSKEKPQYKKILTNKKLIFFILFYVLLMGTSYTTDSFFAVYLESRGLRSNQYGLVYSYFVIFEVLTMLILNKFFKKNNPHILLIIASVSLFLKLITNYLYLPVIVVVIFSCFRGILQGILLYVSFQYVVNIVGEKSATFAIMLLTLCQSIYVAIFNNINGNVIEHVSYKTFYLIAIIISIFVTILAVVRFLYYRKKEINT